MKVVYLSGGGDMKVRPIFGVCVFIVCSDVSSEGIVSFLQLQRDMRAVVDPENFRQEQDKAALHEALKGLAPNPINETLRADLASKKVLDDKLSVTFDAAAGFASAITERPYYIPAKDSDAGRLLEDLEAFYTSIQPIVYIYPDVDIGDGCTDDGECPFEMPSAGAEQTDPAAPLEWCMCHGEQQRLMAVLRLVNHVMGVYPRAEKIQCTSIASGSLLQDIMMVRALQQVGYQKIKLCLIDLFYVPDDRQGCAPSRIPGTEKAVEKYTQVFAALFPTGVEIVFYQHVVSYLLLEEGVSQIITLIDPNHIAISYEKQLWPEPYADERTENEKYAVSKKFTVDYAGRCPLLNDSVMWGCSKGLCTTIIACRRASAH